jgi:hypothetical protein
MLAVRESGRRSTMTSVAGDQQINRSKNFPQGRTFSAIRATNVAPLIGDLTMALKKRRARRRGWSNKDLSDLKAYAKKKTPARSIGRYLKRSEGAVRQKAYAVGVSLSLRKRRRRKTKM